VLIAHTKITYKACPGVPIYDYYDMEMTGTCSPQMSLTPGQNVIEPNGQTPVTTKITVGCSPQEAETVTFSVTGKGTIDKTTDVTKTDGTGFTTLTGGSDEGKAVVTAISDITYPTKVKRWKGPDLDIDEKTEQTVHLEKSATVIVTAVPVLTLTADSTSIEPNESTTLTAQVTWKDKPLEDQTVEFTLTGPATLSPTTDVSSMTYPATTTLKAGDSEGVAVVTATCNATVTIEDETIKVSLKKEVTITISKGKPVFRVIFDASFEGGSFEQYILGAYSLHLEFDIDMALFTGDDNVTIGNREFCEDEPFPAEVMITIAGNQSLAGIDIAPGGWYCPAWIETINVPSDASTFNIWGHVDPSLSRIEDLLFNIGFCDQGWDIGTNYDSDCNENPATENCWFNPLFQNRCCPFVLDLIDGNKVNGSVSTNTSCSGGFDWVDGTYTISVKKIK
jgi:hypothetical protein